MSVDTNILLREVREYLNEHRAEMVDCYCVHDDQGNPILDSMDAIEAAYIERIDLLLADINAVLGTMLGEPE